ncbi:polysaccharide pyruvyl transferase family protein [Aciduricibacillus chroicocephali]|uniref:Polysaccharide pyruvyl transferase family protein n=1 Tax=Aciduricibacillus chroicocephali TaxID=3054939 RepID=A0ABY9KU82_9BACI|nr:polysaccharide pyruvyl transferase family protein [Bacillaceae bacterium 44XB]
MTVGIVGNYGNHNEGDEAILAGILHQLDKELGIKRDEVVVFSKNPANTEALHNVTARPLFSTEKSLLGRVMGAWRRNYNSIKKLDFVIIGGGGILMDLYKTNVVMFALYGWMARKASVPYIVYGAGAGPIATTFGKRILHTLGKGASLITVRDQDSAELIESLHIGKPVSVIPDPALALEPPAITVNERPLHIGVTVLPYHDGVYWPDENQELYTNYIEGMARNLDRLLSENPETHVHFFATKQPYDAEVAERVREHMRNGERCTVENGPHDYRRILEIISEQDVIIGTRLHSIILAAVAKKPTIAIGYHRKVGSFMEQAGCSENLISIEALHKTDEAFSKIFTRIQSDWQNTCSVFANVPGNIAATQGSGIDLLKESLPELNRKLQQKEG